MLVVRDIARLVTCVPHSGDPLGSLTDAALVATDGQISWLGPAAELPPAPPEATTLSAGGMAVLPGLIDCHTHLIHLGDRSQEFAARARGTTYLEIAAAGGGILATVRAVRAATPQQLVDAALPRLQRALRRGVTTVEIKSGYGLDTATEVKLLRTARELAGQQPVEIVATYLGAHAVPPEHRGTPAGYVREIVAETLPAIAQEDLATFCDVYIEHGAFDVPQAREILQAAARHGLRPKLHVDQFSATGGCALAAELGAVSADHLEASGPDDIEALRRGGVVAVILPLCEVFLGRGRPAPGRQLREAGVQVAVASDFNPGSANCESLPLAATLAVSRCGLSVEDAILGITACAADALGRDDIGRLRVGARCDLVLLDTPDPVRLIYDMGLDHVRAVVKSGRPV